MTTPQRLSDRYELGEILGFGGMSEVHRAVDTRLHREVAVKVLRADLARDPSFYLRFRREAQNAAALNHPAIVAVYDTGEAETPAGPLPYIVMELVEGETLRDIVHNDGPMPPIRAIEVIADACQALNFSHQHGIIHRDVKPANIMIDVRNAVKVMDFGIARAVADAGNSVTQTAAVIGTAQYLSPEQARGDTVDARSDVYSLGCVLYEILTGDPPFVGDSPVAVAYQHVREDPIPPSQRLPGLPADLDAVVLKALAKNPDNRYQTAAEMRADLVRVHNGETPEAPRVLTEADRASLLAHRGGDGASPHTDPLPRQDLDFVHDRPGSVGRWLTAAIVLAVLTVIVTVMINTFGGRPHPIQVPDVSGQASVDAIAELQNKGFKTRTEQRSDSRVPPDHVIGTDPPAGAPANKGDKITVDVSYGPEQRQLPDVATLSYADAVKKLTAAGFGKFKQVDSPSTPELKDKVVGTNPPANQTTAVTNEIIIVIGSGPATKPVPDVTGQTLELAQKNLTVYGFTKITEVTADSPRPAGEVIATSPPSGEDVPLDAVIELRVSRGNQFVMPDVTGLFWTDVEPQLRALGWTGILVKGADVDAGGAGHNRVLYQSPAAGQGVNTDGNITLRFGQ
ncbi:Stk1 family PASTA domain-containing Ser/Thr kinase [[Mycobacterium] kokjensenii]|uniref:Serine/threonine-protein kinase PknB n=1 Tax=[Mycobacterium] kokjensenii TaxID=3064287 RepID=A0ABN9MRB2_9MYCO|nr:Stk1 family PASTA domain-containing Ser/Thr kinase [Mycolicibacter sp. MU0083]CAJ1492956.1 Stk1 family PASTA domain-containing Ser/Thr kinase [Mycolicibacter sp. MU0083]